MSHCNGSSPLQISPAAEVDDVAIDVIQRLLKSAPSERLGAGLDPHNGYSTLKMHPFFASLSWGFLRENLPPFIPETKTDTEVWQDGSFDDWLMDGEATPILPESGYKFTHVNTGPLTEDGEDLGRAGTWEEFLQPGETQIFTGIVWKRKGLFSKRRQLVLTDKPRYVVTIQFVIVVSL